MSHAMPLERRGHYRGKPRPGRKVAVEYTIVTKTPQGPEDSASLKAFTQNIGIGGAFIVTEDPAPPGSALRLTVVVPSATKPILVKGEVRWIADDDQDDPQGMGVKFYGLEVEELLLLNEYFASLTQLGDIETAR